MKQLSSLQHRISGFTSTSKDRGLASSALANGASTGSHGDPRRDETLCLVSNVLSGIDIAVVKGSAFVTSPRTNIKRHRSLNMKTNRTCFARRKETIYFNETFPFPFSFVSKKLHQSSPSYVTDSLSKFMILHHTFNMQILDGDDLVFVNKPTRNLVQIVFPTISNFFMGLRYNDSGFVSRFTSFHFTREFLLLPFQILFGPDKKFRIIKFRSVTSDNNMSQTHINSNNFSFKRNRRNWNPVISQYRSKIFTRRNTTNRNCFNFTDDFSMDYGFYQTYFREIHSIFNNFYPLGILDRLLTFLRFKFGVFCPTFKEIYESPRRIQTYILQYLTMCFSEAVVPKPSSTPECFCKGFFLQGIWIDTNLGGG